MHEDTMSTHQHPSTADSTPTIEILVVRNPDGPTVCHTFVDGERGHHATVEVVDVGAGALLSDWHGHTDAVKSCGICSPEFAALVAAEREAVAGSHYIYDDTSQPSEGER